MGTKKIIEWIFQNYLWIALLLSLFVAIWNRAEISFSGQTDRRYDRWINFTGAAIGWLALYAFIVFVKQTNGVGLSFSHITLLIIGSLGIVGFLPNALVQVIGAIKAFLEKNKDL